MSNKLKTILQKEINPTKTVAIFSVLFLTLSLVYYFTIFLPEEEAKFVLQEARIESELQLQKFKEKQEELRKAELEISTLEKGHLFDDVLDNDVENEDWFENRPDQTREEDERLRSIQDYNDDYQNYYDEEFYEELRKKMEAAGKKAAASYNPPSVECQKSPLEESLEKLEQQRKERQLEESMRSICEGSGGDWYFDKCFYPPSLQSQDVMP